MRSCAEFSCSSAAGKAEAEVSFKGKTIEVILGSTAGGGTDGTTRLVGQFLEKYLPGNPSMRYRNLPGGHGAKALNYFVKVKPDGLTWVGGGSSHVDPNSLRKNVVEYDPTKFHIFGGVQRGGSVVFMRTDHKANLTDKSKPPVVIGVIDGDRSWEQMITWGAEYLGWNVRFVVGYPGSAMMLLAIRRGETHMMGTSNLFILKDMFKSGEFVGVAQFGGGASVGDDIESRSEFGIIPIFNTMMQGKLTGLAGRSLRLLDRAQRYGQMVRLAARHAEGNRRRLSRGLGQDGEGPRIHQAGQAPVQRRISNRSAAKSSPGM